MLDNKSYKIIPYDFNPAFHREMRMFDYEVNRKARDILSLGYGVFNLEKALKYQNLKEVKIERFLKSNDNEVKKLLSELIAYVLLRDIDFNFINSRTKLKNEKLENPTSDNKTVVLFSGGVDSFSGIFWAKDYYKNIEGLFCAHPDQGWSIHIVNGLTSKFLSPSDIQIHKIKVPPIQKGGYSQLRGFLYLLSAASYMNITNANKLIVTECGTTMYQPKFGLYDSVTMTTHPYVVNVAFKLIKLLLEQDFDIILPFENMTKAEVIANTQYSDHLNMTHSCISQRFGTHDGTCYGCIIRRLGAIVAGVKDVKYSRNPLTDGSANDDNLISVLIFSLDLLTNYGKMPLYQIENIESFNKRDLFKRFALDNFAAVHQLVKQNKRLTIKVRNLYNLYRDRFSTDDLEQRIKSVRDQNFSVNVKPLKYLI